MSSDDFLDRIKSDLHQKRQRRFVELAKARKLITSSQLEVLEEAVSNGSPALERVLLDRAWMTREQFAELRRAVDGESLPTSTSPLLARYELHEKLGDGSMSQVFRGTDRQLQRPVAIKILKENLLSQEAARRRFAREAQSLARMDHPNVVRVYDFGESGTQAYLVMEMVEGEALSSVLGRNAKDLRELLALFEQAARGIQHAHEKGIIHRDIKPQNFLVTKAGELKVADFGLAHLLESDPGLTGSGAVLGTPLYMAPEQARGGGAQITPRTDIYGLGAVLYEILTGGPPHQGESVSEIYEKVCRERPRPPRQVAPGVAAELEVIALKAIEKDPSHRYASAEEFAVDLRRYLSGEPILARPVSAATRWARWARRRQALLWPVFVTGVLAVIGICFWIGHVGKLRRHQGVLRLLESARPPLEKASRAQYSRDTSLDDFTRWLGEAEAIIDSGVRQAPDLPLANYLRGEVQILKGRYEEAEQSLKEAVALDPKFGPAHFRLGQVLLWQAFLYSQDMWDDTKGLRRATNESRVKEGARAFTIAQSEGSGFDSELQREVAAAMQAYLQDDFDAVRKVCARGIDRFGDREGTEEFHWLLGLLPGTEEDRFRALNKAIEIKPMFPLALYSRAFAWTWDADRWQQSLDDFNKAILIQPEFVEAYMFRTWPLVWNKKDIRGALDGLEKALALGKRWKEIIHSGRGFIRLNVLNPKDIDGAIADFNESIRLRPEGYSPPYARRAQAYYKKKDYEAALRDSAKAIEVDRNSGVSHAVRKTMVFGRALDHIEMRRMRAKCFLARGDSQAALADLSKSDPLASREAIEQQLGQVNEERLQDEKKLD